MSFFVSLGAVCCTVPGCGDADLRARSGLSPDLCIGVLLEYHTVAEKTGWDKFGLCADAEAE